ncbi:DUF551 domain-containing protein [Allopusillimonas ginsengisoli]|uniref:DUF551 domain-containing protein n=1 Tax=Allopusillimonas ginsengisoli TaxID=453575 RepID=UPI00101FC8D3|nr:DUF551 domain-containing protein [Allopusillimonas ginsengisoli]TEA78679.1 DUF551 domain-containing protein [Allopusillimonas ginsengisoli]
MTTNSAPSVEELAQIVTDHLTAAYVCTRVWEAWSYGTMGPDDFVEASETEMADEIAAAISARYNQPAMPWINVKDQLPAPGVSVLVFTPPQPGDYPGDVRVEFDFIDPDSDESCWHNHNEHYEHYCCVAKGGSDVSWTGPSEEAPYTHWMAIPVLPRATLTQQEQGK